MGKERHRSTNSRGAKQPGRRRPLGDQLLKERPKKRSSGATQESTVRVKKQRAAPREFSGNRYSGTTSRPGQVDHVSVNDLTPETFWSKYVSQRRPVVISGHIQDESFGASSMWTNKYLAKSAGQASVKVEFRDGQDESYGCNKKQNMSFADFLSESEGGRLYLTTQEVDVAPDGYPELFAEPLKSLAGDIPLRPVLLGNLVPQSINIWMGCSPEGSSSGLHHDFHDNLYVLLRGKKRFRLYSPDCASKMYTHGKLQAVHQNGRIVYKGDGDIRPDGADVKDAAAWETRQKAINAITKAESCGSLGVNMDDSERAMEAALDSMLDGALEDGDLMLEDDYDDSGDEVLQRDIAPLSDPPSDEEPPSFSKVDLQQQDDEILRKFPNFPGKAAAGVAQVEAGEMLFLPAGWFHEVTSQGGAAGGGHLALNYWMHPPDNMDSSTSGFNTPYQHDLWPSLWKQRCKAIDPGSKCDQINKQPESHQQRSTDIEAATSGALKQADASEGVSSGPSELVRPKKSKKKKRKQKTGDSFPGVDVSMGSNKKHRSMQGTSSGAGNTVKAPQSRKDAGFGNNVGSWFSSSPSHGKTVGSSFEEEDAILTGLMAQASGQAEHNSGNRKKKTSGARK